VAHRHVHRRSGDDPLGRPAQAEDVPQIDAPVRGNVPEATTGRLGIHVGARDADFAHVQPILIPLGTLHDAGEPGTGAATKLVVNLTLGATMTALGEALALAATLGLDRETLLDILAESPIGSTVPVTRSPAQPGRELRLAAASRSWLQPAQRAGADDLDHSAVVATILGADSGPSDTHGEASGIWRRTAE
jgi:hypothetical protein